MIIGIGSDLVDINRIKNSVDRFGNRFINRIFTSEERLKADSSGNRIAIYAKRFAAKEAAWKALGLSLIHISEPTRLLSIGDCRVGV